MSLLLESPRQYFERAIKESFDKRGIKTYPLVADYLVQILEHFLDSRNLHWANQTDSAVPPQQPQTLAEMLLLANSSDFNRRAELLKQLGDRTLYISGFFGDSLSRKLVDLDYYRDMGVAAYSSLSSTTKEDTQAKVFSEIADRFIVFSDVFTLISQTSQITNDSNILRIYERYLKTGSDIAKDRLLELGILNSQDPKKMIKPS